MSNFAAQLAQIASEKKNVIVKAKTVRLVALALAIKNILLKNVEEKGELSMEFEHRATRGGPERFPRSLRTLMIDEIIGMIKSDDPTQGITDDQRATALSALEDVDDVLIHDLGVHLRPDGVWLAYHLSNEARGLYSLVIGAGDEAQDKYRPNLYETMQKRAEVRLRDYKPAPPKPKKEKAATVVVDDLDFDAVSPDEAGLVEVDHGEFEPVENVVRGGATPLVGVSDIYVPKRDECEGCNEDAVVTDSEGVRLCGDCSLTLMG